MNINNCPRFHKCNAPICPLDRKFSLRTYKKGETVCRYLTELSKPDGRAILEGCLTEDLLEAVMTAYPAVIARWTPMEKQLRRSAGKPSRLGMRIGVTAI